MQHKTKLSLFSAVLMSTVLVTSFAANSMLERWQIRNTAISVSGRLAVYNLDGSEVYAHDWGEFRLNEAHNWIVSVKNMGGDRLSVAWKSENLSSSWSLKAYYGWNETAITNIYPESSSDLSSVFVVWLDPQQQFYIEFILQKIGAGSNADFSLDIMSVAT